MFTQLPSLSSNAIEECLNNVDYASLDCYLEDEPQWDPMVPSTSAWDMAQVDDSNATPIVAFNSSAAHSISEPICRDDAEDDPEQHENRIMRWFNPPADQDELVLFDQLASMHTGSAIGNDRAHIATPSSCLGLPPPSISEPVYQDDTGDDSEQHENRTIEWFNLPIEHNSASGSDCLRRPRPTNPPPADNPMDMALAAYMHAAASGWNKSPSHISSNGYAQGDTIPPDSSSVVGEHMHAEESFEPSLKTALRCPHLSCSSKLLFTRRCDLYKHYRLHFRKYFCRAPGCAWSHEVGGKESAMIGFATIKDRNRHEKSHNPSIPCPACGRLFGRHDNMRDHYQKLHVR